MDKYSKVRVLGKGSFGSAILIKRKIDGALFVVKEVSLMKMGKKERDEARHECTVLQSLQHPNIVRYVEHFENHNNLYIVMEYCDGGDLAGKIKASPGGFMKEHSIMYYFSQVCLAMEYLHARHILHRDIKTMNVFLMKNGAVKLGDFGISTVLRNTLGMANTVCGTPYYFSPELCRNKPYNNKSDVWALGILLYECASGGRHPFDGCNMNQLMQRIVKGSYPPLSSSYSLEFRQMVDWCLQKEPQKRPSIKQALALPIIRRSFERLEEDLMLATQCRVRLKDIIDFDAHAEARANHNMDRNRRVSQADPRSALTPVVARSKAPALLISPGQAAAMAMAKQPQPQPQPQPRSLAALLDRAAMARPSAGAAATPHIALVKPKPGADVEAGGRPAIPMRGAAGMPGNPYKPWVLPPDHANNLAPKPVNNNNYNNVNVNAVAKSKESPAAAGGHVSPYHQHIMNNIQRLQQAQRAAMQKPTVEAAATPLAKPAAFAKPLLKLNIDDLAVSPPANVARRRSSVASEAARRRPSLQLPANRNNAVNPSDENSSNNDNDNRVDKASPMAPGAREPYSGANMQRVNAILARYDAFTNAQAKETIRAYMQRKQDAYMQRQKLEREKERRQAKLREMELQRALAMQRRASRPDAQAPTPDAHRARESNNNNNNSSSSSSNHNKNHVQVDRKPSMRPSAPARTPSSRQSHDPSSDRDKPARLRALEGKSHAPAPTPSAAQAAVAAPVASSPMRRISCHSGPAAAASPSSTNWTPSPDVHARPRGRRATPTTHRMVLAANSPTPHKIREPTPAVAASAAAEGGTPVCTKPAATPTRRAKAEKPVPVLSTASSSASASASSSSAAAPSQPARYILPGGGGLPQRRRRPSDRRLPPPPSFAAAAAAATPQTPAQAHAQAHALAALRPRKLGVAAAAAPFAFTPATREAEVSEAVREAQRLAAQRVRAQRVWQEKERQRVQTLEQEEEQRRRAAEEAAAAAAAASANADAESTNAWPGQSHAEAQEVRNSREDDGRADTDGAHGARPMRPHDDTEAAVLVDSPHNPLLRKVLPSQGQAAGWRYRAEVGGTRGEEMPWPCHAGQERVVPASSHVFARRRSVLGEDDPRTYGSNNHSTSTNMPVALTQLKDDSVASNVDRLPCADATTASGATTAHALARRIAQTPAALTAVAAAMDPLYSQPISSSSSSPAPARRAAMLHGNGVTAALLISPPAKRRSTQLPPMTNTAATTAASVIAPLPSTNHIIDTTNHSIINMDSDDGDTLHAMTPPATTSTAPTPSVVTALLISPPHTHTALREVPAAVHATEIRHLGPPRPTTRTGGDTVTHTLSHPPTTTTTITSTTTTTATTQTKTLHTPSLSPSARCGNAMLAHVTPADAGAVYAGMSHEPRVTQEQHYAEQECRELRRSSAVGVAVPSMLDTLRSLRADADAVGGKATDDNTMDVAARVASSSLVSDAGAPARAAVRNAPATDERASSTVASASARGETTALAAPRDASARASLPQLAADAASRPAAGSLAIHASLALLKRRQSLHSGVLHSATPSTRTSTETSVMMQQQQQQQQRPEPEPTSTLNSTSNSAHKQGVGSGHRVTTTTTTTTTLSATEEAHDAGAVPHALARRTSLTAPVCAGAPDVVSAHPMTAAVRHGLRRLSRSTVSISSLSSMGTLEDSPTAASNSAAAARDAATHASSAGLTGLVRANRTIHDNTNAVDNNGSGVVCAVQPTGRTRSTLDEAEPYTSQPRRHDTPPTPPPSVCGMSLEGYTEMLEHLKNILHRRHPLRTAEGAADGPGRTSPGRRTAMSRRIAAQLHSPPPDTLDGHAEEQTVERKAALSPHTAAEGDAKDDDDDRHALRGGAPAAAGHRRCRRVPPSPASLFASSSTSTCNSNSHSDSTLSSSAAVWTPTPRRISREHVRASAQELASDGVVPHDTMASHVTQEHHTLPLHGLHAGEDAVSHRSVMSCPNAMGRTHTHRSTADLPSPSHTSSLSTLSSTTEMVTDSARAAQPRSSRRSSLCEVDVDTLEENEDADEEDEDEEDVDFEDAMPLSATPCMPEDEEELSSPHAIAVAKEQEEDGAEVGGDHALSRVGSGWYDSHTLSDLGYAFCARDSSLTDDAMHRRSDD